MGAVTALLLAAAFAGWLIADEQSSGKTSGAASAVAATAAQIGAAARAAGHAVYWAGPRAGLTYELTRAADGSFFVRYLPRGVGPGDPRASFLTVATYPDAGGLAALRALRGTQLRLPGRGLALIPPGRRSSVYLAFPGSAIQVEVYDPSPAVARRVALSGAIVPAP